MEQNFEFPVFDLSEAQAGGELSPLEFDKTEYTFLDEFIQCLQNLPDKPVKISNKTLSVNGRVVNDRMDKYLSAPYESSSALKEILKTPKHYLIYKNSDIKPKNIDYFNLGTFIHSAFLEPTKFNKVKVEPKSNRGTIEGMQALIRYYWEILNIVPDEDLTTLKMVQLKDKLNDLIQQAKGYGYEFVNEDNDIIIRLIRPTYNSYGGGILPILFKYLKAETSFYGKDPATRLPVKIRPDAIGLAENFGMNFIISFKTTSATSVETFLRDCAKYKYELSEGMYLDVASQITGRKFTATLMVMIQTVIPFQIALIYWDAEDLQVGKYKYYQALDIVKSCRESNNYPGWDCRAESGNFGIIQGKLPAYIKSEIMPSEV